MFPIRDNNPSSRVPFVVILLIAMNTYVFVQELLLPAALVEDFVNRFGLIPLRDFTLALQPSTYISSMFLHGGLMHLLLNMWSLWIFGDNVEDRMGRLRFMLFYLLCGIAASATHAYLNPTSEVPVVGASGAISGVMGAYMFLYPTARIKMFTLLIFYPIFFEIPAVVFLVFWFLGQLMSGAQVAAMGPEAAELGGIAFAAHIGGFVAGMALRPFFAGPPRPRRVRR